MTDERRVPIASTNRYLRTVLRPGVLLFPRRPFDFECPLFSARTDGATFTLVARRTTEEHACVPAIAWLLALGEDVSVTLPVEEGPAELWGDGEDGEDGELEWRLRSEGRFPFRWLHILADFAGADRDDCLVEEEEGGRDFEEALRALPVDRYNEMVRRISFSNETRRAELRVGFPDGRRWCTANCRATPETREVMRRYQELESAPNRLHVGMAAAEGGIDFEGSRRWIREYIDYNHSAPRGSVRAECKGHARYTTGRDITFEELAVLYMGLRKLGCSAVLRWRDAMWGAADEQN